MASMRPVIIQVSVARDEPTSSAIRSSETVTMVMSDPKVMTASITTPSSSRR